MKNKYPTPTFSMRKKWPLFDNKNNRETISKSVKPLQTDDKLLNRSTNVSRVVPRKRRETTVVTLSIDDDYVFLSVKPL